MNDLNPVIWNINASLFLSEHHVKVLKLQVASLRRQLDAERRAYRKLNQLVQQFTTELGNYAESLSGAGTTPNEKGAPDI